MLVVDGTASRLEAARRLGGEAIDMNDEDVVAVLQELTQGSGPDKVIDAVCVDAERPRTGPGAPQGEEQAE